MTTGPINVLIVEDHELTRVGLKLTLAQMDGIKVIGEAEDGRAGVRCVHELQPHVVLMDIGLPLIDGIEATRRVKEEVPSTRVIMLTSHDNDRDIFAALGAGADGYCLKEVSPSQLAMAIKTVADGAAWLDPGIASRVLKASALGAPASAGTPATAGASATAGSAGGPATPAVAGTSASAGTASGPETPAAGTASPSSAKLSQREIEVLNLVVEGLSNQQIAEKLILSVETVKTHMRHIMEKLAVSDRTQAAVKAMRQGLV